MSTPINRRRALGILGGAMAGLPALAQATAPIANRARQARPNIVFIMTDDQRQDAMSAYGNTILRTPGMDRIAATGVQFDEAFQPRSSLHSPAETPASG